MYYVCIAYYLENDIRWRLMAYRYFETYIYTIFNNVILIGLELLNTSSLLLFGLDPGIMLSTRELCGLGNG